MTQEQIEFLIQQIETFQSKNNLNEKDSQSLKAALKLLNQMKSQIEFWDVIEKATKLGKLVAIIREFFDF